MPSFDKLPLKKQYIKYAIERSLQDPKAALMCLFFGIGPGMTLKEYRTAKNFFPENLMEEKMVRYHDSWQHIPTIYLLCYLKKPKTVLELGCRTGNTSIPMLMAVKEYGGHVYSVDLETWPELDFINQDKSLKQYWTFIQANDLELEWDKPIDFLHIDTDHTYAQVFEELKKYEPHVSHGGIITFHDIYIPEVNKAISDYFKNRNDVKKIRYFNNNGLMIIFKQ